VAKVAAAVAEETEAAAMAVAEATPLTTDMPAVQAASVLVCAFFMSLLMIFIVSCKKSLVIKISLLWLQINEEEEYFKGKRAPLPEGRDIPRVRKDRGGLN
jgi:hypothetical protein